MILAHSTHLLKTYCGKPSDRPWGSRYRRAKYGCAVATWQILLSGQPTYFCRRYRKGPHLRRPRSRSLQLGPETAFLQKHRIRFPRAVGVVAVTGNAATVAGFLLPNPALVVAGAAIALGVNSGTPGLNTTKAWRDHQKEQVAKAKKAKRR